MTTGLTSLQRETIISELTKVALRLEKLAKNSANPEIRLNAEIRLARISSVLNALSIKQP